MAIFARAVRVRATVISVVFQFTPNVLVRVSFTNRNSLRSAIISLRVRLGRRQRKINAALANATMANGVV